MRLPAHYKQLSTTHFITSKIDGKRSVRLILCKIRGKKITLEFKNWQQVGDELLACLDKFL